MDYDTQLTILADTLDDLEEARKALDNRIRSAKELKGGALVAGLEGLAVELHASEHAVVLNLQRTLRKHPLYDWVKRNKGLGEKTVARFLGLLGNPLQYETKDGEVIARTVGSLWHYCGYAPGHDKRVKGGGKITYNPAARTRMFLIAEACMKNKTSPFRVHYDEARAATADKVHDKPCQICAGKTPKGVKPADHAAAVIGKPWKDGHKHMHAIRMVAKHILRDLWIEADEKREELLAA